MGKKRAKEHYDFIKEQYYKEIDNSIANTTIHACESIEARIPQYQNNYSVTPEDSFSCLFSLENKDNVAVLNFASYKKPGGLYFQGVESQEESLCLESTLLPVIEAMLDRINFMLSIAEEHGVQTLILGAWGCGVFEWNPEIVAELFIRRSWVNMVFNRVLS